MSDENDEELWALITRDVDKIERKSSIVAEESPEKALVRRKRAAPKKEKSPQALPETGAVKVIGGGVDRKTAEKLRKGKMVLEARLDLHGMRQIEAYEALNAFVLASYSAGKRCVLVITGKGAGADGRRDPLSSGQGVLKRVVPQWLGDNALSAVVLKVEKARPQHGGDGALYVLLRRKR